MSAGRLRAAIVIGHLGYGGAERQLTELVLRMSGHGVFPHVFCLGGVEEPYGSALRKNEVALTSIPRRGGFDWRRALELASHLRREPFDLVHSFLIDNNPYAFLASRRAGIRPFIASNRNANFPRGSLRALIDGWVFRRASTVLVNARAVARFTAQRFRVPAERFTVIYNGVDLERFQPPAAQPSSTLTIGTVGSLYPKKNPELFAAVATEVKARYPAVRCLHLGDGPMRAALVARHGGIVEFLGTSDRAEDFLKRLDVFLLTSSREGCPNVLLEAMACGRACVATDAGGVPEVLRDGSNGYVVALDDSGALIDRTCVLLEDPGLRDRIGRAARTEVEARFTLAGMVRETVALYRHVVSDATPKAPE